MLNNSKGHSGYIFWFILQKNFAAFSHRKLKVEQIWPTHQSKALIFYFDIKKFWIEFLKILWDKAHFTSSNLVCVYTHPKFQNMKFSLSDFDKIFKNTTQKFVSCQNRLSQLSIDGLIISVPLLTFGVRKRQKFFYKMGQKVYPERPFEFRHSIFGWSAKNFLRSLQKS